MAKTSSQFDPTVVDAASLYSAGEAIAERFGRTKVTLEYTRLRDCLEQIRREHKWRPASLNTIVLSIDPNSEGQQRFQTMLSRSGFEPDVVHYRDTFVSAPPGRTPSETASKPTVSLAPRLAYITGLMSRHQDPHFLVVTHSFELYGPLTDLAHRVPSGKIGIAYFASLLDYRWKTTGLLDNLPKGPGELRFFDLDPFGKELVDVDLAGTSSGPSEARAGLSRF